MAGVESCFFKIEDSSFLSNVKSMTCHLRRQNIRDIAVLYVLFLWRWHFILLCTLYIWFLMFLPFYTCSLLQVDAYLLMAYWKILAYLFKDLGGNSNSPTEMVSTALREILTTCWHVRLMKSYLHTSRDLQKTVKRGEIKYHISHVARYISLNTSQLNMSYLSVISTSLSFSLFQWSTLWTSHTKSTNVTGKYC